MRLTLKINEAIAVNGVLDTYLLMCREGGIFEEPFGSVSVIQDRLNKQIQRDIMGMKAKSNKKKLKDKKRKSK